MEKELILLWGFICRQSLCFRDSGNVAAFISFLSTPMTEQLQQAKQATGKENNGTLASIAVLIVYLFPFFCVSVMPQTFGVTLQGCQAVVCFAKATETYWLNFLVMY